MRAMGALAMRLLVAGGVTAQGAEQAPPGPAVVDYGAPAAWICRPGADDATCMGGLDATRVEADGQRMPAPFHAAARPPIDCFYVYPTTSDDPGLYSDMAVDASERRTVHAQAARLASVCRLFAPAYRQLTSAGLRRRMEAAGDGGGTATLDLINGVPYRDVRAAWRSYLAHDNGGRGVVLFGHSQGAFILKKLLAEEVDGKPTQRLLVGAYLAGNPNLGSRSFRHIQPCRATGEVGCLVAWSSYAADYVGPRAFGSTREGTPVCVNPAALGGGRGMLDPILPRPGLAPASDPPFVEAAGQLSAECVTDDKGAVLRVRVEPGRYAALLQAGLMRGSARSTWGLHPHDVQLVQGNMVGLIARQGQAWAARAGQAGASTSMPPR